MKRILTCIVLTLLTATLSAADGNVTRLYCKVTQSWWTDGNATVGIYAWTEDQPSNADWPGVRMTAVDGENGLWYADVDTEAYQKVIFTRLNADEVVEYWGTKTQDLSIPTDGKNLYTITSTTAQWDGDGGVIAGVWTAWDGTGAMPALPNYYIVGNYDAFGNWTIESALPMYGDSIELTLPVNAYEFKIFPQNTSWDNELGYSFVNQACSSEGLEEAGTNNIKFTVSEESTIKVQVVEGLVCVIGNFGGEVPITGYSVVGDASLFGTGWNQGDTRTEMTRQEGDIWTYTLDSVLLGINVSYPYKVIANHSWSVAQYPSSADGDNYQITVDKAGYYSILFTFVEGVGCTAQATLMDNMPCIEGMGTWGADGNNVSWLLSCDNVITLSGYGAIKDENYTKVPWYEMRDLISHAVIEEGITHVGNDMFYDCTTLQSVVIPQSVTSLGDWSFRYTGLTHVTIPSGVTTIGKYTFQSCSSLRSITCEAVTPPSLGTQPFVYVDKSIPLYVPQASISAYQSASGWSEFTNIQAIEGRTYYLVGNTEELGAWTIENSLPMYGDSLLLHLAPSAYSFKIFIQQSWENELNYTDFNTACSSPGVIKGDNNNIVFVIEEEGDVIVRVVDDKICLNGNITTNVITDYSVVGDSTLVGVQWDPTSLQTEMTQQEGGIWTYRVDSVYLFTGGITYQYKIVANHTWDVKQYPSDTENDNYKLTVPRAGTYSVLFTFVPEEGCTATATIIREAPVSMYSVMGSTNLFGKYWDETDTQTDMTLQGDGSWTYTIDSIYLDMDSTYYYKFTADHSLHFEQYPSVAENDNYTFTVPRNGTYSVTFTLVPGAGGSATTALLRGNPYYLVGSGAELGSWDMSRAILMDGDSLELHLPASAYEFKVFPHNTSWDNEMGYTSLNLNCSSNGLIKGASNSNNIKFIIEQEDVVNVKVVDGQICVTGVFGTEVAVTGYSVVGDSTLFGVEYDTEDTRTEMTLQQDGSWTYTMDSVYLTKGKSYNYKITANHTWSVDQYPKEGSSYSLHVNKTGWYSVTFTLIPGEGGSANATSLDDNVPTLRYYLVGSGDYLGNWEFANALPMYDDSIELTLPEGYYQFKVLPQNTSWDNELGFINVNTECSSVNVYGDSIYYNNNVYVHLSEYSSLKIKVVDNQLCVTGNFIPLVLFVAHTNSESFLFKGKVKIGKTVGAGWVCGYRSPGSTITVEAIPGASYLFSHWSDGNTDNPRDIVVIEPKDITAIFEKDENTTGLPLVLYNCNKDDEDTLRVNADGLTASFTKYFSAGNNDFRMSIDGYMGSSNNVFTRYASKNVRIVGQNYYYNVLNADLDGEYTFTYRYADSTLSISYPQIDATYYLIGSDTSMGLWNIENARLMDGDSIVLNLPANAYEFKVFPQNTSWDNELNYSSLNHACSSEGIIEGTNHNIKFTLEDDGEVHVRVVDDMICLTGIFGSEVTINSYSLLGDVTLLKEDWDTQVTTTEMTQQEGGIWTYHIDSVELTTGLEYHYKVIANHTWSVMQYPSDSTDYILTVPETGMYAVTFTLIPGEGCTTNVSRIEDQSGSEVGHSNGRYVSINGDDQNDGKSWQTAKASIQSAILTCPAGDTVYIAAGTYNQKISASDGVCILGGYNAQTGERDINRYETIIDGTNQTSFIIVKYDVAPEGHILIDGLTIQNSETGSKMAPVFLRGNMTLNKCHIKNCSGDYGGAIYIEQGDVSIQAVVSNCIIEYCSCSDYAGAIYNDGGIVENCIIRGCEGTYSGIYNKTNGIIRNCLLHNNANNANVSSTSASCIYNIGGQVINSTVCNNYGTRYAGIRSLQGKVVNSIFWGNQAEESFTNPTNYISASDETHHNVSDEGTSADAFLSVTLNKENNAADGPNFVNPTTFVGLPSNDNEKTAMETADFSLTAASTSLLSQADASAAPATDILDINRPQGAGADIGAYEFFGEEVPSSFTAAPTPEWPAEQVKSIYSDAYVFAPASLLSYNEPWWNQPNMEERTIANDHYLYYDLYRAGMIGSQFAEISVVNMEKVHIDVYSPATGAIKFNLLTVDLDESDDTQVTLNLQANQWNSFDINLSEFGEHDWTRLFQFSIMDYEAAGLVGLHIAVDNIYLYRTTALVDNDAPTNVTATVTDVSCFSAKLALSAEDNMGVVNYTILHGEDTLVTAIGASGLTIQTAVPNLSPATMYNLTIMAADENNNLAEPVTLEVTTQQAPEARALNISGKRIVSVFCDAVENNPYVTIGNWAQTTVTNKTLLAEGDSVFNATQFDYLGWDISPAVNANDMEYLHVDFYTTNIESISLTPISPPSVEGSYTVNLNQGTWTSVDVPLSAYSGSGIDWSNIYQFKFTDATPAGGELIIDNVYFYRSKSATRVEDFTPADGTKTTTYVTEPTTKTCSQADWTVYLGGILTGVGKFDTYAAVVRAKKSSETEYGYLQSSTISGGINDLWFTWNSNGNESGTNWDVKIYVNDQLVGNITDPASAQLTEPPFNTFRVNDLHIEGDFTIKIVNESPNSTTNNKMRMVIDDLSWTTYDGTGSSDNPDDTPNDSIPDTNVAYYLTGAGVSFGNWELSNAVPMVGDSILLSLPAGNYEFNVLPQNTSMENALGFSNLNRTCSSGNIYGDVLGTSNTVIARLEEAGEIKIKVVHDSLCVIGNFAELAYAEIRTSSEEEGYISINNAAHSTWSWKYDVPSATVRLEAFPQSGYVFSHWSDSITDNPRLMTMNEDIYLTAIFAKIEDATYHVNWMVNGELLNSEPVVLGSKIAELPEGISCSDGRPIVGWTTIPYEVAQAEEPAVLYTTAAGIPAVTEDMTLYAVFAQQEAGGTSEPVTYTFDTNSQDGWVNTAELKGSYWLLNSSAELVSPEVNLAGLTSITMTIRTYGGTSNNTVNVFAGEQQIGTIIAPDKTLKEVTWTKDETLNLSGNSTIRFTTTYTGSTGVGFSSVVLNAATAGMSTSSYSTVCDAGAVVPVVVKHGVRWYVNGELLRTDSIIEGATVSMPATPASCASGQVFVGWTTMPMAEAQDNAPDVLYTEDDDVPAITEDLALYAVYASKGVEGAATPSTYTYDAHNEAGWTNTATKNSSYWLLTDGGELVSPEVNLAGLQSITMKIRTYGGTSNNTVNVFANGNQIATLTATGATLTNVEWQNTQQLTGYAQLHFQTTYTGGKGVGFSSVTVNSTGGAITCSNYSTVCQQAGDGPYYLVGSGTELGAWTLERALLMEDDGIVLNLPANAYEFKVLPQNTSWVNEIGYANLNHECSSEGLESSSTNSVKFTLAQAGEVHVQLVNGFLCVTGQFGGEVPVSSYSVVGDSTIFGTHWDTEDLHTEMTLQEGGAWTYTMDSVPMTTGVIYQYKIIANHTWAVVQYPSEAGSYSLSVNRNGIYSLTFTLVPEQGGTAVTTRTGDLLYEPYISCAEAVSLMPSVKNATTEQSYSVTGYVTNTNGLLTPLSSDTTIKYQVFYMDDVPGSANTLQGYQCYLPEGASALQAGDRIVMTGKIMNYNNTAEIKNGDVTIIERAEQVAPDTIYANVCQAIAAGKMLNSLVYSTEIYVVAGRLPADVTKNSNNLYTFDMQCDTIFEAYNCSASEELDLHKGDSVHVIGRLYNYKGLIEVSQGQIERIQRFEDCRFGRGYCGANADSTNVTWELTCDSVLIISGTGAMANYRDVGSIAPSRPDNEPAWAPARTSNAPRKAAALGTTAPWGDYSQRIKAVRIESGVTSVGQYAFSGCSNMKSVTFGEGLEYIGDYAFSDCSGLEQLTVPGSVRNIGAYAFNTCNSLNNVTLQSGVDSLWMGVFSACQQLTRIELSSTLAFVDDEVFRSCTALRSISLPSSVNHLGLNVFAYCTSLDSLYSNNPTPFAIEENTFDSTIYANTNLLVPESSISLYQSADYWRLFSKIRTLQGVDPTIEVTNCAEAATAAMSVSGNNVPYNGGKEYTIQGYVTAIVTAYDSSYNNITFWMADTQDGGNILEAYRARPAMADSIPAVGDLVKVTGQLTKYGTTPELAAGGTVEIIERGEGEEPDTPIEPLTLDFGDVASIDDWTITNATIDEENTTIGANVAHYAYSIQGDIPSQAYVTAVPHIVFMVKNDSVKQNAFVVGVEIGTYYGYYQTGGKNGIITVKNTTAGDIIKLYVAAKGSSDANFADSTGVYPMNAVALTEDLELPAKGSESEVGEIDSNGYVWRTIEYKSLGGTVVIKEVSAGYRIRSISVEHGDSIPVVTIDPTTCAEAREAALSVSANNEPYNGGKEYTIQGYVTEITTAYSDQYHNMTFWMADASDGGQVLEAYRCTINSEADVPAVGDLVKVTGQLTKHNSTPEFAAGCTSVIIEKAVIDTVCTLATGTCGANLTWALGCDSVLTISGSGAMADYLGSGYAPWYEEYRYAIKEVVLPTGLTRVGAYAFYGLPLLTSVIVPGTIVTIAESAFSSCSNLSHVTLQTGLDTIGNSAFEGCTKLTAVVFPNTLTYIGASAFSGCSSLTSIVIPSSVNFIGEYAFYGCNSLTDVTINSDAVCSRNYETGKTLVDIFGGYVQTFTIGSSVRSIGDNAFYSSSSSSLRTVVISSGVTSIGSDAFSGNSNLTSLEIPNTVTSVGENAFENNQSLSEITIPGSVKHISPYAFSGCSSFTRVTLMEGIDSIGNNAFENCPLLGDILFPSSLTYIGESAFSSCNSLTSVTIPSNVEEVGTLAFYNCRNLTEVTILSDAVCSHDYNSNYTLIDIFGEYVKRYVIGEGVESIGYNAFYYRNADSLRSVVIPSTVTAIGRDAFYGKSQLDSLTCYAVTPPTVDEQTFYDVNTSIPVYVPAEAIDLYRAAEVWKEFLYFRAIGDTTALNPAETVVLNLTEDWMFVMLPGVFGMEADDLRAEGGVVWATYNGELRASGRPGWQNYAAAAAHTCSQALIVRAADGEAKLTILVPEQALNKGEVSIPVALHPAVHAQNANWNFIGNPYPYPYDIMTALDEAGIYSPITVWNGTGYDMYTPGIDEYILQPFEAFFIQLPDNGTEAFQLLPEYIMD